MSLATISVTQGPGGEGDKPSDFRHISFINWDKNEIELKPDIVD